MADEACEVVVLGMGTCGEDAALRLATAGVDVIGIEGNLIGGECPYWACLPTKSMIRSANLVAEARRAHGLVGSVDVETDWATIARRIRAEITGGWDDAGGVDRFETRGGRFVRGWARVTGPGRVEVGDIGVTPPRSSAILPIGVVPGADSQSSPRSERNGSERLLGARSTQASMISSSSSSTGTGSSLTKIAR